jgi:ABC-type cobalamin transport system permease subunit
MWSGLRERLLPVLVVGAAAAAAPAVVHVLLGNVKVNLTAEMHF